MATLLGLTPQQKAALVVVSGLPAPAGVGGVIVQGYDRDAARPPGALVFVDQEGGKVRTFPNLSPRSSARAVRGAAAAYASGRATGVALRGAGVDVDLAPVLDLPDGPLGSLPFSTDEHPYVRGRVREADLAPYRAAVEAGVPCVMVGHGVYPSLGARRATLEPATYRLLHELGFDGVAITDSLDVVRGHAT